MDELRYILLIIGVFIIIGIYITGRRQEQKTAPDRNEHEPNDSPLERTEKPFVNNTPDTEAVACGDDKAILTADDSISGEPLTIQPQIPTQITTENSMPPTNFGDWKFRPISDDANSVEAAINTDDDQLPNEETGEGISGTLADKQNAPVITESSNAGSEPQAENTQVPDVVNDTSNNSSSRFANIENSLIITINVLAYQGGSFPGVHVKDTLDALGLKYGNMRIYHFYTYQNTMPPAPDMPPLFSVANIKEPGCFDLARLDSFTTSGLSLFMLLPGPMEANNAFEVFINIGNELADRLGGYLCDDNYNKLTKQAIAHIKDNIAEFSLRQQLSKTN